jgi:hypothetical protein
MCHSLWRITEPDLTASFRDVHAAIEQLFAMTNILFPSTQVYRDKARHDRYGVNHDRRRNGVTYFANALHWDWKSAGRTDNFL